MSDDQKDLLTGVCFAVVCVAAVILGGLAAVEFSRSGLPIPVLP